MKKVNKKEKVLEKIEKEKIEIKEMRTQIEKKIPDFEKREKVLVEKENKIIMITGTIRIKYLFVFIFSNIRIPKITIWTILEVFEESKPNTSKPR